MKVPPPKKESVMALLLKTFCLSCYTARFIVVSKARGKGMAEQRAERERRAMSKRNSEKEEVAADLTVDRGHGTNLHRWLLTPKNNAQEKNSVERSKFDVLILDKE